MDSRREAKSMDERTLEIHQCIKQMEAQVHSNIVCKQMKAMSNFTVTCGG